MDSEGGREGGMESRTDLSQSPETEPIKRPPLIDANGQAVDKGEGERDGEDGAKWGDDGPVGHPNEEEDDGEGDTNHGREGGEDGAHLMERRGR